jgi:hypothetical protein
VHDGTDPNVAAFLSRPVFGPLASDAMQRSNISAFVQCLDTGTAPACGYGRTITSNNVTSASVSNDWSLLEAQTVGGTNIDLIVKGTVDGVRRGFVYQTAQNNYKPDKQSLAPLTRSNLVAKILAGGTITIMGVPPGTGTRNGIDRNLNGVLDADEPAPSLKIVRRRASAELWATNSR